MKTPLPSPWRGVFSWFDALAVIAGFALLFLLAASWNWGCGRSAEQNVTKVRLDVIRSGLENYRSDLGVYPEPAKTSDAIDIGGRIYDVSGAAMLYQVLTGDGSDRIRSDPETIPCASNGRLEDAERTAIKVRAVPKDMWTVKNGTYFLIDGYGKPYQYMKAGDISGASGTISSTYDLWSYGKDIDHTTARSIETLADNKIKQAALKWTRNW